MTRGIERRNLFLDDGDRADLLERLERILPEEGWRCFAWVFMPNHVHLVVQSTQGRLSRLMSRVNTGFAQAFNRRHCRAGYLFQNRFKSRVVQDEIDLAGLVAYVHRNPMRSQIVHSLLELETYPWCGLGGLLGTRPTRDFESIDECLQLFAPDPGIARARLRQWIAHADDGTQTDYERTEAPGAVPAGGPVPGDPRQVNVHSIRIEHPVGDEQTAVLASTAREISRIFGTSPDGVLSTCARGPEAQTRSIVAWFAIDRLRLRRHIVAKYLGISPSAVSHALRRGRALLLARGIRLEAASARASNPSGPREG